MLVALLGSGAARAQQWPSEPPRSAQAPNRQLIPFPGSGGASGTPGNPQTLPVRPSGADGARQQLKQLSPSQQQQLFAQDRDLQLRFLRERIQLLKSGERCLTSATNLDQLRNCKREERQANMDLRRRHHQDLQAMLQRYGVKLPDRPGKGGRWGRGPGGPGSPAGPGEPDGPGEIGRAHV